MAIDNEMEYLEQIEAELQAAQMQNRKLTNAQLSLFGTPSDENLIKWQLDLREDLDRIYHLLKGHVLKEDEKGNIIYVEQEDDNLKPFNETGVQLIMNVMSFYLNRNTILSNYDSETINWKVHDFGVELIDLIFNKYEEMGMDTEEKMKMYPMIVKELVDSIHSAYLRAYNGGERDSLRTARTVTQSMTPSSLQNMPMVGQQQKPFKIYNPLTWGRA